MTHLSGFLSKNGIVVATLIGRRGIGVHKIAPFIAEESRNKILADYNNFGYGYSDYENHNYISGSYSISLARASVIIEIIESIPNVRLYSLS